MLCVRADSLPAGASPPQTNIWRARLPSSGASLQELRDSTRTLHARFYGTMACVVFVVVSLRQHTAALTLALHSFWCWQIAHTAATDTARPLSMRYVWGISACRLATPLYYLACPRNWARVATQPRAVVALVAWMGVQVGVMHAQHRWGARCFLPARFSPACAL